MIENAVELFTLRRNIFEKATEQFLVIEDNPAAIEVAAIVEDVDLSMAILKYNHYSLQDSVDDKRAILVLIAQAMDSDVARREFEAIDKPLAQNVYYAFNNLHIRHDNVTEGSKGYKKYVADMNEEVFKASYDDVDQMILLLYLKKEQKERDTRFKALKENIENGNDDK